MFSPLKSLLARSNDETALTVENSGEIWRPIPNRLVFLDFDGVLHKGMTGTLLRLPAFETWLRSTTDVGIVISSSWRHMGRIELERLFSPDCRANLIGCTVPEGKFRRRQSEIVAWASSANVGDYVVLDDDHDEFDEGWPHWLHIDRRTGLTDADIAQLHLWSNTRWPATFRENG